MIRKTLGWMLTLAFFIGICGISTIASANDLNGNKAGWTEKGPWDKGLKKGWGIGPRGIDKKLF